MSKFLRFNYNQRLQILYDSFFCLRNTSSEESNTAKEFKLRFCRSPVEILSTDSGRVSGIKFEINNLIEVGR